MKLFKTREKEPVQIENKEKPLRFTEEKRESLLDEYNELNIEFAKTGDENIRLRMVEITETIHKNSPKIKPQKQKRSLFSNKKLRFDEKFCHKCNHSIQKHHKKGRSTGCKCGCLLTVEEIMNPTDNGHDKEEITKELKKV